MNDVIHSVKQLCKVVRWALRSSTYKSEFYSPCADMGWIDTPPHTHTHLFLPFLDRTKVSSSLFSWHILRGRQGAKSTQINHFPCYFKWLICNPRRKCPIAWSLGTEMVGFPRHLSLTWILTAVWTWPHARPGIWGADFCGLPGR